MAGRITGHHLESTRYRKGQCGGAFILIVSTLLITAALTFINAVKIIMHHKIYLIINVLLVMKDQDLHHLTCFTFPT